LLCLVAVADAQPCSTGADGPLTVTGSLTLNIPPNGEFHFTTITIQPGAVLRFNRNATNTPPSLLATGAVTIHGTVQLSAIGRTGGPGGGDGGALGNGLQAGTDGTGPSPGLGGLPFLPNERPGNAGGGGGMATAGGTATRWTGPNPAPGGAAIGFPTPLTGGSGGGGGSGWRFFGVELAGGDGGGAGGGIRICSAESITISGDILCDGVEGHYAFANIGGHGGPGGGGSGGVIDLRAAGGVAVQASGELSALGGRGGGISTMSINHPDYSCEANGGIGYVRIEAASIALDGDLDAELIVVCPHEVDRDGDVDLADLAVLLYRTSARSPAHRAKMATWTATAMWTSPIWRCCWPISERSARSTRRSRPPLLLGR
jgi:hypothetical protein